MRPIAIIFAVISLMLGTLMAWGIAVRTINWVETAQAAELEQSMYAAGIDWLVYEPDGFLMTISGEALDARQHERALQIAGMIVDNGLIDITTVAEPVVIAAELSKPMVEIMRNGNEIVLIGRLPQGAGRAALDRGLAAMSNTPSVVDITETLTGELPEGWHSALGFAVKILPQTERAIITVTPGQVVVDTVAGSATWQEGLNELLENMRPSDVSLLISIAAPRPVISPYRFSLDPSSPDAAICSAQDEVEVRQIANLLRQLNLPEIDCEIGIGAPSTEWGRVVKSSLETLAQIGGSLEISDSDIRFTTPVDVDPEELVLAIETLSDNLPEVFSLHSVIPDAPLTEEEIAAIVPAEFNAALSNDGIVTLSGALKDALTRDVVVRYAEAKFGYNLVESDFSDQAVLPDGWQTRVFASVEALSLLESGQLAMTPDTFTLTGVASFETPEDEISKLLKAALGGQAVFELDLAYEPRDEAAKNALDPRICAARVTTILGDNQISFAPSSAVIEESSKPTIEAIAAILTNCRSAEFEIGGHTDSQGREEMNRSLSQSRADAVLDAMLAQNLLLGTVTAVGYGESEPIADNQTEEGRAENRRIAIILLRGDDGEAEEESTDE
ncbi:MAG: OmpA family protein [Rhodobacteraceae bacterium]|nr:OmpA family protein [Paracoccaceae bacterium]